MGKYDVPMVDGGAKAELIIHDYTPISIIYGGRTVTVAGLVKDFTKLTEKNFSIGFGGLYSDADSRGAYLKTVSYNNETGVFSYYIDATKHGADYYVNLYPRVYFISGS